MKHGCGWTFVFRHTSVVDNMVSMMEKYSSQLEEQVAERSSQLAEEKHKTELLLLKMLPKLVKMTSLREYCKLTYKICI